MHPRSIIVSLLVLASLLGSSLPRVTATAVQRGDTLPDVPAMLLRAEDLADADLGDLYLLDTACQAPGVRRC